MNFRFWWHRYSFHSSRPNAGSLLQTLLILAMLHPSYQILRVEIDADRVFCEFWGIHGCVRLIDRPKIIHLRLDLVSVASLC